MNDITYCRDCHRPIVYLRTKKGKLMPCDSARVDFEPGPGPDMVFLAGTGELDYGWIIRGSAVGGAEKAYTVHFGTCPARRRKAAPKAAAAPAGARANAGTDAPARGGKGAAGKGARDGAAAESGEVEYEQLSLFPAPRARLKEALL